MLDGRKTATDRNKPLSRTLNNSQNKRHFTAWDRLFCNNFIAKNKVRTATSFVLPEVYVIWKVTVQELPPKLRYELHLPVLCHSDPVNGAENLVVWTCSIMSKSDLLYIYISVPIQYISIIHEFVPVARCFHWPLWYTSFNSRYQPLPYKFEVYGAVFRNGEAIW